MRYSLGLCKHCRRRREEQLKKKSPLTGHLLTGYEYSSSHIKEKRKNEDNMGDTGYQSGTSGAKRLNCVLQGDLIPNEKILIT